MTECEKLRDDLKAFQDGQLSPAARIAVRMHLNRCEACRKEIEEMQSLGTRMRAADSIEMSDALRDRILASIPTGAPESKVKMLPRWREKPVMLWGACASAALAWFLLYPTLETYREPSRTSATGGKSLGTAFMPYTQDYDASDGSRHYTASPTGNIPSDATHTPLSITAANGRGPGATDVVRQTQLSARFHNEPADIDANADEKPVYFSREERTDNPLVRDHGSPYFPSSAGLHPLVGNGNGKAIATLGQTRSAAAAVPEDGIADAVNDVQTEGRSAPKIIGGVRGTLKPESGKAPLQIAQGDRAGSTYEQIETDPSRNSKATPDKSGAATPRFVFPRTYDLTDTLTERQVHKEASLTVEVANAEQQSEAVERLVKESKGYVAQNQLSTQEDNTRQASLTCKVPVDQFDAVLGQIARLGLLKGKTLSGEDITEKVSDEQETGHVLRADIATTEAKLKTRRRHSDTVHDEETLRQLRIRIAQSQARLKMLTRLGDLSEITVELDEKPKTPAPVETKPTSPFMQEVSGTGQAAAHSFLMALRLPIQLLVWIVVYSPLWALLIFAYRRMTR